MKSERSRAAVCNRAVISIVQDCMKLILIIACSFLLRPVEWLQKEKDGFTLYYQSPDSQKIEEYNAFVKTGMKEVKAFFSAPFKNRFSVYIHPHRKSLDSTWQHDWKLPDFTSECWMIASGVAHRLDMIAPVKWDTEACEHRYENKTAVQGVITHELVHVYHAQQNRSKDFGETENLDWFVEGLATYASGQLTDAKFSEVRQAVRENQVPASLNDFWKGKMRYQLSGSVLLFIDKTFGRGKITSLLACTRKAEVLSALKLTEEEFLSAWKNFVQKY